MPVTEYKKKAEYFKWSILGYVYISVRAERPFIPFLENFFPGKYGLRENMWCLIKGFSELIQYVGRKKFWPLNCRKI